MAANNYFSYGGTQYAQANPAYQPTQQAYGVQSAAAGASASASFASQRSAYDATYQTSATPVTYAAPAAVGVTYDSTKTFYQQASPAVAANTVQGAVTVGSTSDFPSWQQANYNARQTNAAAAAAVAGNKVAFCTSYSAAPTSRQLAVPQMGPKIQTTNASFVASQFNNQQPSIANPNFNYSNSPTGQCNKTSIGTIGQQPKKVVGQFQQQKQTTSVGMPSAPNAANPNTNISGLYNLCNTGNVPPQNPALAASAYPSIPGTNYSNANVGNPIYNNASGPIRTKSNHGIGNNSPSVGTPGTYSNTYDQALFNAAATMYMNQNPRAASKTGIHYKPRPGLGTNPKFRNFRPPKPQQLHYCDACKISCAGPSAYHDHLQGQKHKKKVAKVKPEQTKKPAIGGNLPVFVCELCDIECTAADAYAAHLRGAKHTKVVKLHTKLGKPIPPPDPKAAAAIKALTAEEEAAKPKVINGSVTPVVPPAPVPKMVTPRITFVAAGNSSNNSIPAIPSAPAVIIKPEMNLQEIALEERKESELLIDDRPAVGSEYIEEEKDACGKLISFNCKLCECKFSDPNAKEMHMKGRKHRLQFKRKVDPKLKVEMKPNNFKNKRNDKWKKQVDKQKDVKRKDMRYEDELKDYFDWCRKTGAGPANMTGMLPQGIRHPLMRSPRPLMMGPGNRMPVPMQSSPPMFLFGAPTLQPFSRKVDTPEDRHILSRHRAIYPTESEVRNIQKHVDYIEKTLKLVSDHMLEEAEMKLEKEVNEKESSTKTNLSESEDISETTDEVDSTNGINELRSEKEEFRGAVRELTGVLRVGIIAKGLVLSGDTDIDLVMLCSNKPTLSLLTKVVSLLPDQLKEISNDHEYVIKSEPNEAALVIKCSPSEENEKVLTVKVTLTSTVIREELLAVRENKDANEETAAADGCKVSKEIIPEPPDVLSKTKCLEALAALRHAKWFQARAASVQSCLIVIRILRDLCRREPSWNHFNSWALELLCEKVFSSTNAVLSPGDGLRRVFECISSGILLPDGPGLLDPCEKDPVDATSSLTSQQREDITAYAQYALRLMAFRQIHKVLGMEMLPPAPKFRNKQMNRKRRRENSTGGRNEGIDGKKDKKDAEDEPDDEQEGDEDADAEEEYDCEEEGVAGGEEEEVVNAEKMETDVKAVPK